MEKRADGVERLTEVDLLIEVLSRLRVKPLLRCKSVSKSWYSLISSPNFARSHLQRAIRRCAVDDDDENNLIVSLYRNENRLKYKKEDGSFSLFNLGSGEHVTNLKFPYSQGEYPVDPPSLLVGVICGIVCVCVDDSDYFGDFLIPTAINPSNIYLWNPAIKQSKLIPPHTIHDYKTKVSLGFGFDSIDFDFKVVRVVRNVSSAISPEVYSSNRDTWQNIDSYLTDVPYSSNFEVCLHGFLITTGNNGMMAFDLNKEVFICDIKLPVNSNDARIVDFKDSIAVIISDYEGSFDKINLWTLDDETCLRGGGVDASWTFTLSIAVGGQFECVKGLFNSVDFLLLATEWFFYNLEKNAVRSIPNNPYIEFEESPFKYTESLLSFTGSKQVNWPANEVKNDETNIASEDDIEESSVDSEDDEESSDVSEDGSEESTTDSEDDNEESYEDDSEESSEDYNGECSGDSASE